MLSNFFPLLTRHIKLEGLPLATLSFHLESGNLRARPEQTQLEDLSDASFLGKLLVLPATVRQDWKVFARCKHSSLFGLIISYKQKKFFNTDTLGQCYKTFFVHNLRIFLISYSVCPWQAFPA
jgi:hypothetical protein